MPKISVSDEISLQPNDSWWNITDPRYGRHYGLILRIWQKEKEYATHKDDTKIHQLMRHKVHTTEYRVVQSRFEDFFDHDDSHEWEDYELVYDFMCPIDDTRIAELELANEKLKYGYSAVSEDLTEANRRIAELKALIIDFVPWMPTSRLPNSLFSKFGGEMLSGEVVKEITQQWLNEESDKDNT